MEGVEDIPGTVLHEGLAWNWQSFPEFIDALDGRPFDVDVALQVPHGALRLHVMGERGARPRAGNRRRHRADGRARRAKAIEAGALGFTTSRTMNHRTSTGRVHADAHRRSRRARRHRAGDRRAPGRGVLQVVSDFADVDAEFAIFRRMAEDVGPAAVVLARADARRQLAAAARAARQANADGVTMTAQVAPRPVGLLLGLQCTLHPLLANPVYREIADRPLAEQVGRDRPTPRSATRLPRRENEAATARRSLQDFDRMFELGDPPDYEPDPADEHRRAGPNAKAATRSTSPTTCCSRDERPGAALRPVPQLRATATSTRPARCSRTRTPSSGSPTAARTSARSATRASRPRCSRSGAATATTAGSPLPFLVQRHTQATARTVGLLDRGVLAPGYRADVNVIDFDRLAARRPEMRYDLPGRRQAARADRPTATSPRSWPARSPTSTAKPTDPLPGRLVRGRNPHRPRRRQPR